MSSFKEDCLTISSWIVRPLMLQVSGKLATLAFDNGGQSYVVGARAFGPYIKNFSEPRNPNHQIYLKDSFLTRHREIVTDLDTLSRDRAVLYQGLVSLESHRKDGGSSNPTTYVLNIIPHRAHGQESIPAQPSYPIHVNARDSYESEEAYMGAVALRSRLFTEDQIKAYERIKPLINYYSSIGAFLE